MLEVDACMVATGRVPYTDSLALEAVGVETERGFVQTDETMQVRAARHTRGAGRACAGAAPRARHGSASRCRALIRLLAPPLPHNLRC